MLRKFLFPIFLLLLFIGCDKLDELTKFNITYNQKATIPSSAGIDLPIDVFTPETETNSESEFTVNDTRKDLIEEIILTKLELVITSPTEADFSFLKSIEIFISAEEVSEIKVASLNDIPDDGSNRLVLDTSDSDLKEYIKKDKFSLRLNTVTDELISTDHELDVNSTFFVDAKILGL